MKNLTSGWKGREGREGRETAILSVAVGPKGILIHGKDSIGTFYGIFPMEERKTAS